MSFNLVSRQVLQHWPVAKKRGQAVYFTPPNLDKATTEHYHQIMTKLFEQQHKMLKQLTAYCRQNSDIKLQPDQILQAALPLAAPTQLKPKTTKQPLLNELRQATDAAQPAALQEMADYFPRYDSGQVKAVQLSSWQPRKEFDLLPAMLYRYSSLPYTVVAEAVETWPYARKLNAFKTYLKHHGTSLSSALAQAHYSWDILTDCRGLHQLITLQSFHNISLQDLTPRHGYEVPSIIEAAELSDQYEANFDLSLELYSHLQQAGYSTAAPYAVLQGHKARAHLTTTAPQALSLFKTTDASASTQELLQQMRQALAEKHPIIAETTIRKK